MVQYHLQKQHLAGMATKSRAWRNTSFASYLVETRSPHRQCLKLNLTWCNWLLLLPHLLKCASQALLLRAFKLPTQLLKGSCPNIWQINCMLEREAQHTWINPWKLSTRTGILAGIHKKKQTPCDKQEGSEIWIQESQLVQIPEFRNHVQWSLWRDCERSDCHAGD